MTEFYTATEVNRTVFVATTSAVLGLVVTFTSEEGVILTVNRWTRDDQGYRSPLRVPAGFYRVTWSSTSPKTSNSYFNPVFDPPHIAAGDNVTVTEDADADSWTISSTGGGGSGTCTVIDGGLPDSTYGSIDPIDGGTP